MSEKRTLKKIDNNEFVLIIEHEDQKYTQKKGYTKNELKENYDGLKNNLNQISHGLMTAKKELKQLGGAVKFTKDEEKIKKTLIKIKNAEKTDELITRIENLTKQQKDFKGWIKEIEVAIPELTR